MLLNQVATIRYHCRSILLACMLTAYCIPAVADIILTAPPRETAPQGAVIYGPLAGQLSKVLGEKVIYQHPGTWPRYQRDMRADKFDIVFDGPHFMSWRIHKLGHTPLVRLPGTLSFVMIVNKADDQLQKLHDLTYESICALAPPNLATITMLAAFGSTEPAQLKIVRGGMGDVYKKFKNGECRAAVMRDADYKTDLTDEQRASTKILYQSEPVANQGITVSSRVKKEMHEKIILSMLDEKNGVAKILDRFAPGEDIMIPVAPGEYDDYYKLLEGIILGW